MRLDYHQLTCFWHPILIEVADDIEKMFGEQTITSEYRMEGCIPNDSGVHTTLPLRAIDIEANEQAAIKMASWINKHWVYDPKRSGYKVAKAHDVGHGFHLHVQVHPNTVEVK